MLGQTLLGFFWTVLAVGSLLASLLHDSSSSASPPADVICGDPPHFSRPSSCWDKSFLAPRILYLHITLAHYPIYSAIIHVPLLLFVLSFL